MTGTGRDPTTCRNTAEQRRKQLAYQRARGRAVTDLIKAHQAEYDHLFQLRRAEVDEETEALDQAAAEKHDHGDEPARLKTGRRKQGQQVVDRIDVARCPHCVKHHDRGHACPNCGAAPGHTRRKDDGVLDEVAVERRLAGDTGIRLTPAERAEVVRRARARGWSYSDIEDHAGVSKPERYTREGHRMTPRELFLLAPHLRLWNAAQDRARRAYHTDPHAAARLLPPEPPPCRRCTKRAQRDGLCYRHHTIETKQGGHMQGRAP